MFIAINIGKLEVNPTSDLEQIRDLVNRLLNDYKDLPKLSDWCFLDCELFFMANAFSFWLLLPSQRAQQNDSFGSTVPKRTSTIYRISPTKLSTSWSVGEAPFHRHLKTTKLQHHRLAPTIRWNMEFRKWKLGKCIALGEIPCILTESILVVVVVVPQRNRIQQKDTGRR